jgi:hypothetical protein
MTTFMRAKFKDFVNDCTIPFESEYNLNERTSTYGGRVLFPGRNLRLPSHGTFLPSQVYFLHNE